MRGTLCARLEESTRIVRLKVRLRNVQVAAARRDGETHAGVGNTLCRIACWMEPSRDAYRFPMGRRPPGPVMRLLGRAAAAWTRRTAFRALTSSMERAGLASLPWPPIGAAAERARSRSGAGALGRCRVCTGAAGKRRFLRPVGEMKREREIVLALAVGAVGRRCYLEAGAGRTKYGTRISRSGAPFSVTGSWRRRWLIACCTVAASSTSAGNSCRIPGHQEMWASSQPSEA